MRILRFVGTELDESVGFGIEGLEDIICCSLYKVLFLGWKHGCAGYEILGEASTV